MDGLGVIRIWGRATSSNVAKVLWLLDEVGLNYERCDVGGPFGKTDTPEYRAINPMGLVPALEQDGYTLFESNAILRYLVNAHAPGSALYPNDPRQRGRVDAWLDWQQSGLRRLQRSFLANLERASPDALHNDAIAERVGEAARIWAIADAQLGRTRWIAGSDFTIADIAVGASAHRWFHFAIRRPEAPRLKAWYKRLTQRPAFVRNFALTPSANRRLRRAFAAARDPRAPELAAVG
jgi:glutathione S-transferase